jgi:hypothetical protein
VLLLADSMAFRLNTALAMSNTLSSTVTSTIFPRLSNAVVMCLGNLYTYAAIMESGLFKFG